MAKTEASVLELADELPAEVVESFHLVLEFRDSIAQSARRAVDGAGGPPFAEVFCPIQGADVFTVRAVASDVGAVVGADLAVDVVHADCVVMRPQTANRARPRATSALMEAPVPSFLLVLQ